jgi:4-hydroxybenzoate polyprenyltransferase
VTRLLKVSRPQFLIGILGLFAFGAQWALLSSATFSWKLLLAGYLAIAAAQLSVHFTNDYFDATHDLSSALACSRWWWMAACSTWCSYPGPGVADY